ncbi:MAG: LmeA family phospholipid-binding protein [Sporichthyaceae bacterium]
MSWSQDGAGGAPARRRRRWPWILLVVVLTLVVVGDRGGQYAVERVIADRIQNELASPESPMVDLGAVPFLPELVNGTFNSVSIRVLDGKAGQLRIALIEADLNGVRQSGGGVQVERLRGSGLITYPAMSEAAAPLEVGFGGDGLVEIKAGVKFLGRTFSASAAGRPRIEGNVLIVKPEKVSSTGVDDETAAAAARQIPEIRIRLRDIPTGLKITLNPTANGIEFTFTGSNVFLQPAP